MVKSTDCSSRGPEFNSQQPHDGSQPSVMRSVPSSGVQIYMEAECCKIFLKMRRDIQEDMKREEENHIKMGT